MEDTTRLTLALGADSDTDLEELERFSAQLREQLLDLDVEAVNLVRSDDVPAGAKPADAITIGALIVTLAPAVLQSVVRLVEVWIKEHPATTVRVTMGGDSLEITNASHTDQQQLTKAFIKKHTER